MGNNPNKEPSKGEGRSSKPSSGEIQQQNEAFFKQQREKFEADYQKVMDLATITGNTWIEFEHNLKEHIHNDSALRAEWNVSSSLPLVFMRSSYLLTIQQIARIRSLLRSRFLYIFLY